jgi:PAS domain S-box-containing protein
MEQKQTEQFFAERQDIFRSLFYDIPLPMWLYDLDTLAFLDVNHAAMRHYGYSREEFLSMTIKDIRPPEDLPALLKHLSRLEQGISVSGTWRHRKKDGTVIDVEIISQGITFGQRRARFVIANDITGRRRAEEALRRSEEKYRDLFENANDAIFIVDSDLHYVEVNKKAVELLGYSKEELLTMKITDVIPPEQIPRSQVEFEKLRNRGSYEKFVGKVKTKDGRWLDVEVNSSAIMSDGNIIGSRDILRDITDRKKMEEELLRSQKLESLGVLAGGLAHDFNNLLTAILGNISLAKFDRPDNTIYSRLEEAEKAALRAQYLTQQLLTFARGGAPVMKTLSILKSVKDSATFALRGSRSRSEFSISDNLRPVEADEGQLSQVINNLIINADQAMPEGGTVRVSCENVALSGASGVPLPPGDYVKISVTDGGIGIPREHFEKIFDPYFTTKQKGRGLGLATSYSIIKRHGGHITVESELGIGTTFSVYLPVSRQVSPQETVDETMIPRGAGRVLVMDDEEIIRDVAGRILEKLGYEVECVRNGAEAVAAYARARGKGRPFDAVIMDLTVPGGMGGKETLPKLQEIDPEVKVIVSSGYSSDPIMAEFRKYGFRGVVSKPYTIKKLGETVQSVIAERGG